MTIFWIAIAAAAIIGIFTFTRGKKSVPDPSLKQIADIIEEYLNNSGGPYDWYDFVTHHSYQNPDLEKIRRECADIAKKFPPTDSKSWCSEQGKNELLKISERVSEEANKAIEARKKSAAEAKAKQPQAAGKSPMGKAPMTGKGPIGKGPMMGKGPMNKGPAIKPAAINQPVASTPMPVPAQAPVATPIVPVQPVPVAPAPVAPVAPAVNPPPAA